MYPFVYYALHLLMCAPYGYLDPLRLQCKCPYFRTGDYCETCKIDALRGECALTTRRCKDKWMGPLCDYCPALDRHHGTCKGECNTTEHWYNSGDTTKCRNCTAPFHCSGHGTCSTLDGTCTCDEGWASIYEAGELGSVQDCGRQCPGSPPCNARGTCVSGGSCECDAPYCGVMCEYDMSVPGSSSNAYCNNMGFAKLPSTLQPGLQCTCSCFTKTGKPNNIAEPVAFGYRCQHECPVGTNGDICGVTGTSVFAQGKCMCDCIGESGFREGACDSTCKFGGISQVDGTCKCLYDNQSPLWDCGRCKSNWFIPTTGCNQYCGVETCNEGTCLPLPSQGLVVCDGCKPNFDPTIRDITVDDAYTIPALTAEFSIALPSVSAGLFDKRIMVVTATHPDADDSPTVQNQVWHMAAGASASFTLDAQHTAIVGTTDTVYELKAPVALAVDHTKYVVKEIEYDVAYASEQACIDMDACVGFSNFSGQLYSCMELLDDNDEACGKPPIQANKSSFAVATQAVLAGDDETYHVSIQAIKRRGCEICEPTWFPLPQDAAECGDTQACFRECIDSHTCNGKGTCDKCGRCVCTYPNADPEFGCSECKENYFPHPDESYAGVDDCQNLCIAGAINDASHDGWYCSGHGACVGIGRCDPKCAAVPGGEHSGWSGPHCQLACDSQANETEICSGHGTCVDDKCSCDPNYFGKLCDVTCSRPEQYYYVFEDEDCDDASCVPVCEDNIGECGPCDNGACVKRQCNGGKCEPNFRYTHLNATFYYEPCTSSLDKDTLQECTAWAAESADEWAVRNLTAKQIREQYGIYCDTGARTDFKGFCKRSMCKCSDLDTVTLITDKNGLLQESAAALPRGGEGCQVVGCRAAQFPNAGDFASFCGEHVPPTIRNPIGYYDLDDPIGQLNKEKARVQQHCSHGVCMADVGQPGISQDNPAPPRAEAVLGSCKCRGTPQVEPAAICQLDNTPSWAKTCCTAQLGGPSPYFGRTCMDECVCDKKLWWKGSCAGDVPDSMSLGCNCRQGYHVDNPSLTGPRASLFCGMTCKTTCQGIVHKQNGTDVYSLLGASLLMRDFCPDAVPTTGQQYEGCYDGFLPCNGHGTCTTTTGSCVSTSAEDTGGCACWGTGVAIPSINTNALLPDIVTLYGGTDCSKTCPGVTSIVSTPNGSMPFTQWFDANYELLHSGHAFMTPTQKVAKRQFFSYYQRVACSGHGWCTSDSAVNPDHADELSCTCLPNWGGERCDKQCTLDAESWQGRMPMQHRIEFASDTTSVFADVLGSAYGLSVCGPNSDCDSNQCISGNPDGHYARQRYSEALDTVSVLTSRPVTDPDLMNFFEQWSLAFVGQFATCASGYYSGQERSIAGQDRIYAFDVPALVRWQLVRSCDAVYTQNTWMQDGGPWCCTYPQTGDAWKDDTAANYAGFTHGGCPDGFCANFAAGRQCKVCLSSAFTDYNTDDAVCPVAGSGQGKCAICAGGGDAHLVSPFLSAKDMISKRASYRVEGKESCERCISHGRELSGEQIYALASTESRVCNNDPFVQRGKCLGKVNTYSGIDRHADDVTDAPDGASLLCDAGKSPQYQLGLCACNDGWEGPTCAMPTKPESCRNGQLKSIGRVSPYNNGTAYNYCQCEANTGHYCRGNSVDNIYSFAADKLLPCQTIQNVLSGTNQGYRLVECNDPTGNSPCDSSGLCQTCAHKDLDPDSLCIEYKAYGAGGIVTQHQAMVKARAGC